MPTPAHLALTPQIDEFRREFERLAQEADALVAPLSDEQFTWQPSPVSWSIAQCIDHLNVTARLYLPQLDEGIANAIRQGLYGEGPFKYWWFARVFVRMLEPPPRMRVKSPAAFQPPPARTRREIMAAFRAYQVQYVDRLRQANGLDLARARVRSPVASWIHVPLGTGFAAMTAHERRHLWQARRVLDAPGFPATATS
jgi:DinB superfamily